MMRNARLIRRSLVRVVVTTLAIPLAACAVLFPPRQGMGGAAAPTSPAAVPAAPASAARSGRPTAAVPMGPGITASESEKTQLTLYARLGGNAGINGFTDDFLGRVTNDPAIMPFFKGLTPEDLARIRQHVFELLCSATGGPCTYTGKDMKTVHKDMEINNATWNTFTGHLNETVARFKIQDRERNELVAIIASLKPDIVNR